MSYLYQFGAIGKNTNEYCLVSIALRSKKYKSPNCDKDVYVKQGDIKIHHFAHYADNSRCKYYNSAKESQIHLDAKCELKDLIDKKIPSKK